MHYFNKLAVLFKRICEKFRYKEIFFNIKRIEEQMFKKNLL